MKKLVGFLTIGLFLSIPFVASAALLGTGTLNVKWSTPTTGGSPNYYADYDGIAKSPDFGYITELEEIFCVSPDHANSLEYVDFYTISPDLNTLFPTFPNLFDKLSQAAWIADHWTSYGTSEQIKAEAQKAVWRVTDVMVRPLDSTGNAIYSEALKHTGYSTDNWYFAHSPAGGIGPDYQDYLTPAAPVPEPATMLLLGSGLIGIAGFGRKKLFNK